MMCSPWQVNSFLRSDHEFCEAVCAGRCQESGSTALVALVAGAIRLIQSHNAPQPVKYFEPQYLSKLRTARSTNQLEIFLNVESGELKLILGCDLHLSLLEESRCMNGSCNPFLRSGCVEIR